MERKLSFILPFLLKSACSEKHPGTHLFFQQPQHHSCIDPSSFTTAFAPFTFSAPPTNNFRPHFNSFSLPTNSFSFYTTNSCSSPTNSFSSTPPLVVRRFLARNPLELKTWKFVNQILRNCYERSVNIMVYSLEKII